MCTGQRYQAPAAVKRTSTLHPVEFERSERGHCCCRWGGTSRERPCGHASALGRESRHEGASTARLSQLDGQRASNTAIMYGAPFTPRVFPQLPSGETQAPEPIGWSTALRNALLSLQPARGVQVSSKRVIFGERVQGRGGGCRRMGWRWRTGTGRRCPWWWWAPQGTWRARKYFPRCSPYTTRECFRRCAFQDVPLLLSPPHRHHPLDAHQNAWCLHAFWCCWLAGPPVQRTPVPRALAHPFAWRTCSQRRHDSQCCRHNAHLHGRAL